MACPNSAAFRAECSTALVCDIQAHLAQALVQTVGLGGRVWAAQLAHELLALTFEPPAIILPFDGVKSASREERQKHQKYQW